MIKFAQQSDLMPFIASNTEIEFGADFDATFALYSTGPEYKSDLVPQAYSHERSSSPSLSSSSRLSTPSLAPSEYSKSDYAMSYHGDDEAQPFYYAPGTQSAFYPAAAAPAMSMDPYTYSEDYSHLEQQSWSTPSLYTLEPRFSRDPEMLPPFVCQPAEVQSALTHTNIIPPTPETAMPAAVFDFNTAPQHSYVSPSVSASRSRETSIRSFSRSTTPASNLSSSPSATSAASAASLQAYGTVVASNGNSNAAQTWRCAFPGCASRALFTRGCDLRKHYNRHTKHLFCRVSGCPQAEPKDGSSGSVGFSSKKDRARHEAKHNPGIPCEWRDVDGGGCGRVFSRVDNMKDHVRRIHLRGSR